MGLRLFSLLSFLFFLSLFLSHADSSGFSFLKKIHGSHKGSKEYGIKDLKKYLENFGYLNYVGKAHASDDYFDETLVAALKTYQKNFRLKPTGILDSKTVETMMKPRCGVADIINGTNYMANPQSGRHLASLRAVSHYSFFPGNPKWAKFALRYKLDSTVSQFFKPPITSAVQSWGTAAPFFSFTPTTGASDIVLGVHKGDHGDGYPFDGPGGVLAHAFAPSDGRNHLDGSENWSAGPGPVSGKMDITSVAAHELGHNLGLGHSNSPSALMYPSIGAGQVKGIGSDDIAGLKALYRK